jgi:hypothetical protein
MITVGQTDGNRAAELVTALRRLKAADTLGGLAQQARERAEQAGLLVFPAVPGEGDHEVHVGSEVLGWERFIDFASQLHVDVLYVEATPFDSQELLEAVAPADDEVDDVPDGFNQVITRFHGLTEQVCIAFAHQGMWHRWSSDLAPFARELHDTVAQFASEHADRAEEPTELTEDVMQHLVDELLGMPEFRYASSQQRRHRVAKQHPEVAALLEQGVTGSGVYEAIRRAEEAATDAQEAHEVALHQRLPELAAELADAPDFRAAQTESMRKKVTAQFLAGKADGYQMSTALRDELATLARPRRSHNASLF